MFQIGEFARLGSVTPRSLRHYHAIGLLVPAEVDPGTGYRGYRAAQLATLNRIVALRELGFSLEQIKLVLSEITVDELRGMLILRRAQIAEELALGEEQLARVESRLRAIERENDMPRDDIVVKSLPAVRVAWISHPAAGFGAKNLGAILAEGIPELAEILLAHDVEIVGQPFGYYEGDPDAGTLVAHVSLPIGDGPVDVPAPVEIVQLPAVPEAVSVVVPAPTGESYAAAYTELGRWIEAHDYEIAGHGRDVYLNTTRPESDADVLMEIQWPVRRTAG